MTALQAFQKVEDAAADLQIMEGWNEQLTPQQAVSLIANQYGSRWDWLGEDLVSGKVSPEEYADRCCAMVDEYSRKRFNKKVLRKIEDLRLDQEELDLVPA